MDPYRNFRFRLLWQGQAVAGLTRVAGMSRPSGTVREGGDPSSPHILPGQTAFDPITLERGVTCDVGFEAWVNRIWVYSNTGADPTALTDFRRDLTLELRNEAGQTVVAYDLFRCWPSEYTALPELDASMNAVAIQTLVLQNEGWSRRDVDPPVESA